MRGAAVGGEADVLVGILEGVGHVVTVSGLVGACCWRYEIHRNHRFGQHRRTSRWPLRPKPHVVVGSRNPEQTRTKLPGLTVTDYAQAVKSSDIVILTVPFSEIAATAAGIGSLAGKTVIKQNATEMLEKVGLSRRIWLTAALWMTWLVLATSLQLWFGPRPQKLHSFLALNNSFFKF